MAPLFGSIYKAARIDDLVTRSSKGVPKKYERANVIFILIGISLLFYFPSGKLYLLQKIFNFFFKLTKLLIFVF